MKQAIHNFFAGVFVTLWCLTSLSLIGLSVTAFCFLHLEENSWSAIAVFLGAVFALVLGCVSMCMIGLVFNTPERKEQINA